MCMVLTLAFLLLITGMLAGGKVPKEEIRTAIENKRWQPPEAVYEIYNTFMSLGVGRPTYRLRMSRNVPFESIVEYSMEAFILLAVENVLDFAVDKVEKKEILSARAFTAESNRKNARKFSGWSEEGKERYNELMEEILDDREEYGEKFDADFSAWFHKKMDDEENGNKKRKKKVNDGENVVARVVFENPLEKRMKRIRKEVVERLDNAQV